MSEPEQPPSPEPTSSAPPPVTPPSPPVPDVVPLVGARIAADHGLSGLGLIMQLAGTLFTAFSGVMGLIMVISLVQLNAAMGSYGGGPDNSMTLWALAITATGVLRSVAHRAAGARLIYDGPGTPFSGIRRYLGLAALQTVAWVAFFGMKLELPGKMLFAIGLMLVAWPATLAVMISLPRYRRLDTGTALPMAEDKGFEGASILMLIFGLTGLGFTLVLLYSVLQLPSQLLAQIVGVMMLLTLVMLLIRSVFHVIAGWRGVNETHLDRATEAASRYGNFGVITAFVAAGAMLLVMMGGGADVAGLLAIVLIGWLLLAWPLIVRKFFSERQFADLLAGGEAPLHRRAPDLGHSTLGWLLLGLGVLALSQSLPQALFHGDLGYGMDGMRGGMNPMAMMQSMMQSAGMRSPWWGVGVSALQVWAAIELIRMTDNHRLVASIYAVIATVVAVYVNLPMIDALKEMGIGGMFGRGGTGGPLMFATVAIGLVVPFATLILVNRKTAPTAQARYRAPAPTP